MLLWQIPSHSWLPAVYLTVDFRGELLGLPECHPLTECGLADSPPDVFFPFCPSPFSPDVTRLSVIMLGSPCNCHNSEYVRWL